MTVLNDSSDCFASSFDLPETIAEEEEQRFFAWDKDLTLFFTWCWADLKALFHLQRPWSFKASTTPTLAATAQVLPAEHIFYKASSKKLLLWYLKDQK